MQPILVYMSKVDGKFLFSPVSVNFLTEIVKVFFAICMLLWQVCVSLGLCSHAIHIAFSIIRCSSQFYFRYWHQRFWSLSFPWIHRMLWWGMLLSQQVLKVKVSAYLHRHGWMMSGSRHRGNILEKNHYFLQLLFCRFFFFSPSCPLCVHMCVCGYQAYKCQESVTEPRILKPFSLDDFRDWKVEAWMRY